jgi:hypothetical protein
MLAQLTCGRQAPLVLACLRNGAASAELAAGFGNGTTTAWRYVAPRYTTLPVRVKVRDLRLRLAAAGR